MDDYIFCDKCGTDRLGSCHLEGHTVFVHEHDLEIGPSTIRNAGRGVFNASTTDVIPEGTVVRELILLYYSSTIIYHKNSFLTIAD